MRGPRRSHQPGRRRPIRLALALRRGGGPLDLTDAQTKAMREYLLRGGFFMCDDFHEPKSGRSHQQHAAGVSRPPIVEIDSKDPIFHTIYDLTTASRCPASSSFARTGPMSTTGTCRTGAAIYDDKGRLMVAICFDMDLGDSWEHADNPEYPQRFSGMGIRIGVQLRGVRDDALIDGPPHRGKTAGATSRLFSQGH